MVLNQGINKATSTHFDSCLDVHAAYDHCAKLAVLYEGQRDSEHLQDLSQRLAIPLLDSRHLKPNTEFTLFLSWRNDRLKLIDQSCQKKGGLSVEFDVRGEQQRSWPAPKKGPLAQAIGRKTQTVVDATTGWGQDSFFIFRMGYQVSCIERSPIMAELLWDGLQRLQRQEWIRRLGLDTPRLMHGNAIAILPTLKKRPDCIYLDPMFPPKRKKSALARKSMGILRDILGDDEDREQLYSAALQAAGKRVVVKRPDYAAALNANVDESFQGKLVRYDVYFK